MKKKVIIFSCIGIVVLLVMLLYRVNIYNIIQANKLKKIIGNTKNEELIRNLVINSDYEIIYQNDSLFTDTWYVFNNKIIYKNFKKPILPHLGFDEVYFCFKVDNLSSKDLSTLNKCLNKKINKNEKESILIHSYKSTTSGYISNKMQAKEFYDILERVKNK